MQSSSGHSVADDGGARVWTQTTIKINLGNYESVELSIGASRPVRNSKVAIKRLQEEMIAEHEKMLAPKVEALRELWGSE